jgi:hypothetical protein
MSQSHMATIVGLLDPKQKSLNIVSANGVELSFSVSQSVQINGVIRYQLEGKYQINFSYDQGVYTLSHNRPSCDYLNDLIAQLNLAVGEDGSTVHGFGTSNYFCSKDKQWVKKSIWDVLPEN